MVMVAKLLRIRAWWVTVVSASVWFQWYAKSQRTLGNHMEVVSLHTLVPRHHNFITLAVSTQFSLGNKPWQPCYVVRLKDTTIMLDCALDMSVLLNFLPIPLVYR